MFLIVNLLNDRRDLKPSIKKKDTLNMQATKDPYLKVDFVQIVQGR